MKRRCVFVYFPGCEVLDFAGPLQSVHELNTHIPDPYDIVHCAVERSARSAQGLALASLAPLPAPRGGDLVFVPGFPVTDVAAPRGLGAWLKACVGAGAHVFGVCTGAFVLAQAGLLNGRSCTTHWKRTEELQRRFPKATVLTGRLFVKDGPITTSAGITAGIDMSLDFIAGEHGPAVAAAVAREMVVYIRRDGSHEQNSVYLEHRTHLDPAVHAVQDWLIANPAARATVADLARIAHTSARTLTRAFSAATGVSISEYRRRLRLEHAKSMLANPRLSIERIAQDSGFADARQLRRLWRAEYGISPRASRPR